jgi:hypothetical protein
MRDGALQVALLATQIPHEVLRPGFGQVAQADQMLHAPYRALLRGVGSEFALGVSKPDPGFFPRDERLLRPFILIEPAKDLIVGPVELLVSTLEVGVRALVETRLRLVGAFDGRGLISAEGKKHHRGQDISHEVPLYCQTGYRR